MKDECLRKDLPAAWKIASCFLVIGLVALLATAAAAQEQTAGPPEEQPNIVLVFSDDHGYGDVGSYGSEIPTPHLDALAREGARFTAWYVAAPVCTPSRYALLTGRAPARAQNGLSRVLMPTQPTHAQHGLTDEEITLAALLKRRGYRTAIIGKWHLGHGSPLHLPTRHGFDTFYGHTAGCIDYFKLRYGNIPDWYRDEQLIEESGYATDLLTDEAVRFIRAQSPDQPFFLYLPYNAPHYGKGWDEENQTFLNPLQAKAEDLAEVPHIGDERRRVYAAMVKALDDGIGRVLAALREAGLEDDTWVIFMSDNGGDPRYGGSNEPLRGTKGTLFEGGIRVPCIMRWPGKIPAGALIDQPLSALDIVPTVTALLGIDTVGLVLDGADIRGVLFEGAQFRRDLFWTYRGSRAVRQGPWKYLEPKEGEPMLFNLERDPYEQHNLIEQNSDVLDRLRGMLGQWVQEWSSS